MLPYPWPTVRGAPRLPSRRGTNSVEMLIVVATLGLVVLIVLKLV